MSRRNRHNLAPQTVLSLAGNVAIGGLAVYQAYRRRQAEQAAKREHYEATHDRLTGALNTRGLEELLGNQSPPRAMLYADGTNQKKINDTLGHGRGDESIVMTAEILRKNLRPGDVLARIGGDEFLVLLDTKRRREHDELTPGELLDPVIGRIGEETARTLQLPANADLVEAGFDIAVGGVVWEQGMSVDDMRNGAEAKMYEVKAVQHAANGSHR